MGQHGNVVGVNTMLGSPRGSSGISFAIPAETLQSVIPQLKERGFVSRGGIGVRTASPQISGDAGAPQPPHGGDPTRGDPWPRPSPVVPPARPASSAATSSP